LSEHSDFTFHHLETNEDVEQCLEIMRSVFGQNSNVDMMVKKWIDHHPTMTLNDFFVIKRRGKMVACLNIIPSKWSIGGIPLKVAELACVATLPEYRHQKLQRILMSKYHEQITRQGYDLSAIEGIPYYYRQFEYEYALPLGESTKIQLAKIPDYKLTHVISPFTSNDIPRAMQLLTEAQQKFYVHSLRDKEIWKMQQETGRVSEYKFEAYAVEENGEMTAYFRLNANFESKELLLREITDVEEPTAQSILGFLKNLGIQRGLETLVATISHHEPFTRYLVATGLAEQNPPYAWQIRIIDYAKILLEMKPLLEKHLASSPQRHLTEKLNFNFYRYTVQITIENGEITNIERSETCEDRKIRFNPLVFVQLLLGHRSLKELQTVYPDFLVQPAYENLINVLFPKLPSYIHTDY